MLSFSRFLRQAEADRQLTALADFADLIIGRLWRLPSIIHVCKYFLFEHVHQLSVGGVIARVKVLRNSLLLRVLVGEEFTRCLEQMRFGNVVVDADVLAPLEGHGVR